MHRQQYIATLITTMVEESDKLTVVAGITLVIDARLEVEGILENKGTMIQNAKVEIEELLENNGTIVAVEGYWSTKAKARCEIEASCILVPMHCLKAILT